MQNIQVLPKHISELIAAGEVVDRPASVIKELIENSIDAGADEITVDISRGGILQMLVRDNGCGISKSDVPTAFVRHATSKIRDKADLDNIGTLGFRGEALAAISAVSKVEIITRTLDSEFGTHMCIDGGIAGECEDIGCNKGTTIIVRDIFYNTPARMKFLKKDVTEGNSVASVVDRMALSHPEIAIRFIRDGKTVLATSGDGNLKNVIYSVLGREFATSLIPVDSETEGISVSGFICKPVFCRNNRNGQFFFLNKRIVNSKTAAAAIEQAYKNSVMVGKFPCCVLKIELPVGEVDVNVHPAKTEVRFSDERRVFSAVYYAVKNALNLGDTRPEIKKNVTFNPYAEQPPVYNQTTLPVADEPRNVDAPLQNRERPVIKTDVAYNRLHSADFVFYDERKEKPDSMAPVMPEKEEELQPEDITPITETVDPVGFIGVAFDTYIIVQKGEEIYFIDKHAAHERILFEQLRANEKTEVQNLLTPVSVVLTKDEYSNIISNKELLLESGFDIDDFGNGSIAVRSVPAMLCGEDIPLILTEIAEGLASGGNVKVSRIDDIYHTVACKAAIKGGRYNSPEEMRILAERVLSDNKIMYCPHGRPVAFKMTRRELEKQFRRIV